MRTSTAAVTAMARSWKWPLWIILALLALMVINTLTAMLSLLFMR